MTLNEFLESLNTLGLLDADNESKIGKLKVTFVNPYTLTTFIDAIELYDNEIRLVSDYKKYIDRNGKYSDKVVIIESKEE